MLAVLPDQLYVVEAILNNDVAAALKLALDGREVHRLGDYCGVVQQSQSFPIDRLPEVSSLRVV